MVLRLYAALRYLLLALLMMASLHATSERCYSVQIGYFESNRPETFLSKNLPEACRIVPKGSGKAVVCGCGSEAAIRRSIPHYRERFPGAFLTSIPSSHFKAKQQKVSASKQIQRKHVPAAKTDVRKHDTQEKISGTKPEEKAAESDRIDTLMYQIFLYNNDLKNALKVAKKVLKRHPGSPEWLKRLADVLTWSGKSHEAFKHYLYLYEYERQRSERKEKPKSTGYGSYDAFFAALGKLYTNPTDKTQLIHFLQTAQKLGVTEEAAIALDKLYAQSRDPLLLRYSASFYDQAGMQKEALARLEQLRRRKALDAKDAVRLARIYYAQRRFSQALDALLSVNEEVHANESDYWRLLTDLYIYRKEDARAAKLLRVLCMRSTTCRQSDYDFLIRYYRQQEPEYAAKSAYRAYRMFHKPGYLFTYADIMLARKDTGAVRRALARLTTKEKRRLHRIPLYWMTLTRLYQLENQDDAARQAFEKAHRLDPASTEILTQYGWFLLSLEDPKALQKIVSEVEAKAQEDPALTVLAAAIENRLGHPRKAYRYYMQALKKRPQSVDIRLDLADLLETMGEKARASQMRRKVFEQLRKRFASNPGLLNDPVFLTHYLRVSIPFLPAEAYRRLLAKAKQVLDPEAVRNFGVAEAVYRGNGDYAAFLARELRRPAVWLRTYLAAHTNDTGRMRELLYRYGAVMPAVERVNFEIKTGQIAKARETLHEAREENPRSDALYRQKYGLEKQYANKLVTDLGYDRQGDFDNRYARLKNLQHLSGNLYLGTLFSYGRNSVPDPLQKVRREEYLARLWLKLKRERTETVVGAGYRNSYSQSGQYFASFAAQLSAGLHAGLHLEKNGLANETVDLRRRGEKDSLKVDANYRFDPRYGVALELSHARYRDQDGTRLGEGSLFVLQTDQSLQFDYPDLVLREYLHTAHFSSLGIRSRLPQSYTEAGAGLSIGKSVTERYNASWKPYADLSATYHNRFGFYFSGGVGLCGRMFGNDYLNLYLGYSRSAAENEPLWNLKLIHNYLY